MQVAQSLYENGHITYMRTDSTNLAAVAIEAARELVSSQYGKEYLPEAAREYRTKVKNAQKAHEAIRPAGHPFALPESLRNTLSADEFKIYDLIWKRTVASQMADARGRSISITIEGAEAAFKSAARRSISPAIYGLTSKGPTIPRPSWPTRKRSCLTCRRRNPVVPRNRDEGAQHAAAGALQRSHADQGASKNWESAARARMP